jgi:hypothetical protein
MTVATSDRKEDFAGGQGTLTYSFYSIPSHPEHIKVTLKETDTGDETDLTYSTHYTVSQTSNGVGGVVTVSPTYSTDYSYTVWRDTTKTQSSDYDDYNTFPADTLEKDLDRLMCISQEINETVDRCVKNPITNSTAVTLAQIQALATTCSTQATAAAASATTASTQASAAATSATQAAGYASSLNIPTSVTGEANKFLQVNDAETGYELVSPASQAQAEAGTESTLPMTALRVKQSIYALSPRINVGSFTRDMTAATGSQAITGCGMTPKAVFFFGCVASSVGTMSIGVYDGTTNACILDNHNLVADTWAPSTPAIFLRQGSSNDQYASVASLDSDGFTLSWTKSGTPVGEATIKYLALG